MDQLVLILSVYYGGIHITKTLGKDYHSCTIIIKMKICYDRCFIDFGAVMTFFTCFCFSRYQEYFFLLRNRLNKLVPPLVASIIAKFEQIL